jgi:hypothetical protein
VVGVDAVGWALTILTGVLVAGYIGINFTADLPRFLVVENIALAVTYTILLVAHLKGAKAAYPVFTLVAGFNAGRVSRSIVTPRGELGELAVQHIPLLALILAVALLALAKTLKAY